MPHTTLQRSDALASVVARGAANVSRLTTRDDDHEVIPWRVGAVVVDLARAEPTDVGTSVDLAQPDSISCDGARSRAAGHSPPRSGRAGRLLSPSWPSAIRLTNAFGTTDLIDAREESKA